MKLMEIVSALEGLPECPECGQKADMEDTWTEYSGFLRFVCKGCGYAGDSLRYDAYAQSVPDMTAVYRKGARAFAQCKQDF